MPAATLPANDKRIKILEAAIRKQQSRQDSLITILHKAQELYGFLDNSILWFIARALKLPPSRVQGVATFYHLFHLKPNGEHACVLCMGTACYVKGAPQLLKVAEETGHIKAGDTSADGKMSLAVARCIGACGIAPVVVLDDKIVGQISPETLSTRLEEWMHGS